MFSTLRSAAAPKGAAGSIRAKSVVATAVLALSSLAWNVQAATPADGTLTDAAPTLDYGAGPFYVANAFATATGTPSCIADSVTNMCDSYKLTVKLPDGYKTTYPMAAVKVSMGWVPANGDVTVPDPADLGLGATVPDYDLFIFKGDVGNTYGADAILLTVGPSPIADAASSDNPEVATFAAKDGTNVYTIKAVPFAPTGEEIAVHVELVPGAAAVPGGSGGGSGDSPVSGGPVVFGTADPAAPSAPRYQTFYAPKGSSAESNGGEYSIGFNPETGAIMTMSIGFPGPVWRVTPPEVADPTAPASGEALWEDKSSLWEMVPQVVSDPILNTDQETGRTWAANLTVGPDISYAYTDDDGENWVNIGTGIAGADHETVVGGAYPEGSPYEQIAKGLGYVSKVDGRGRAVYFCSQDAVGPAGCTRSDDGGLIWGPMQIAYDGSTCGGLHGHLHIAPDGTAYLPVKDCGAAQGGSYTADAGDTWTQFQVPGTAPQANGSDPSIAIDDANNLYFCYVDSDGHARVKTGTRDPDSNSLTWSSGKGFDLGATHGITNASFTEAVGGDPGRAACGFLGTDNPSPNYQSQDFTGVWYLYIATTIDGGQTWTTVNATPNDPVQGAGGIWQQGGSGDGNSGNRNLLDFNEITLDDKGRVLFGYNDGCVTQTCINDPSKNDFVAYQRVARQTGGHTLRAAFDSEMAMARAPGRPALSGTVTSSNVLLSWKTPDHGGSEITHYTVIKTPAGGSAQSIDVGDKTAYVDSAEDRGTSIYTVTATNAGGMTGDASNPFDPSGSVVVNENVCALPGLTKLTDPANDQAILGIVPEPLPEDDMLSMSVTQPYAADGNTKIVFQIKVSSLAQLIPHDGYYTSFKDPAGVFRGVRMYVDETGTAQFQSYLVGASNGGQQDGRFVSGSPLAADASSGYNADGTITIVVDPADIGLANAGDQLTGFNAGVTFDGVVIGDVKDEMPDGLGRSGTFTYLDNETGPCAPNHAPSAALSVDTVSGSAPLNVTFTVGMTDQDAGDTLSYSLDFGDGTAVATGTAAGAVAHTYTTAGQYAAVLTVTDSKGATATDATNVQVDAGAGPMSASLSATYSKSANADGTYTVSEANPLTVTFTAAGTGGDGTAYLYTFNFGDGTHAGPQSSATATHDFKYSSQDGYHTNVVITNANATDSAKSNEVLIKTTTQVTVSGTNSTTLSMTVSPTQGKAPLTVTVDATGSTHASGTSSSTYSYDFGDGTVISDDTTGQGTHVYTVDGTYTLTVTLTDYDGSSAQLGQATATQSIVVGTANVLTAQLSVNPTDVLVGDTVTFDGCHSIAADGDSITAFELDPGDGSAVIHHDVTGPISCTAGHSDASVFTYIYSSAGSYAPVLTVSDDVGNTAKSAVKTVTVRPTNAAAPAPAGGAFGLLSVLGLAGAAALRRRKRTTH